MRPFSGGIPHCKRCGYELDGGEDTCPRCQFSPREKGLRISLALLMVVVIAMTVVMILPQYGIVLIQLAGLSFLLSLVTLVISFIATPYRLGRFFLRL